jgi:threonylcarbamoyladenosine tRNA methylthiotransferase CDKAL1
MKVCIITYGCAANRAESEIMAGLLKQAGHSLVSEQEAEIMVLNTCAVKQVTEQKILDRISTIHKPLVVAGCLPEVYGRKIRERSPNAVLLGTHHLAEIVEATENAAKGNCQIITGPTRTEKLGLPRVRSKDGTAIIEIADGCLGSCSYCATRLAKGPLFSYSPDSVIREVCCSLAQGCNRVWLTSQDTAAYGKDIGVSLPGLLRRLPEGHYQVRVGMMNPNTVLPLLDRLLEAYQDKKIWKFLHLPLQSGSDEILKAMNRPYTTRQFEDIVNAFRKEFPDIKIWTDVIVGYPGETETQFQETVDLLKKMKFDKINISRFAKRDGTVAAKLKQLPTEVLKRRTEALHALSL